MEITLHCECGKTTQIKLSTTDIKSFEELTEDSPVKIETDYDLTHVICECGKRTVVY